MRIDPVISSVVDFQICETTILRRFQTSMATKEIIGTFVIVVFDKQFEGSHFKRWQQNF